MVANLIAEINEYEDTDDLDGSPVTLYLLKISFSGDNNKVSYTLRKRYSEFSKLYNSLRTKFAKLDDYRFPNKSMFNTQSNFTKERRRQGFDELVKLLLQLMPESEISEFFELERHILDSKKSNTKSNQSKTAAAKAHLGSADDLTYSNTTSTTTTNGGMETRAKLRSKELQRPVVHRPGDTTVNSSTIAATTSLTRLFIFNILPSSTAVV